MNTYRRKNLRRRHKGINNNIVMLTAVILILSITVIGRMNLVRADESVQYEKSFHAIEVESGDTLSAIAQEYAPSQAEYEDYMNEVIEINGLKDGKIHAGCYLMIPIYTEVSSK